MPDPVTPDPVLVDEDIVNRALGAIGGGSITSLDEDSELALSVIAVYPDVVDAAHAAFQWRWARKTKRLDRLDEKPENGFLHAFGFPVDAIGNPLALFANPRNRTPHADFAVEGRTVYADPHELHGSFIMRQSPALWPPLFRAAVTMWLQSRFALSVTHDATLAQALEADAIGTPSQGMQGGLMGRAIAVDVAQGGARGGMSDRNPLTNARFDGPWHGRV